MSQITLLVRPFDPFMGVILDVGDYTLRLPFDSLLIAVSAVSYGLEKWTS